MFKNLLLPALILIAFQGLAQNNYFTVKFPDDLTFYSCGTQPFTSYPTINQTGNCSFNVGVAFNDQTFYTAGGNSCAKVLRTWTLIWWCDYNPNTYTATYVPNPGNSDVGPTVTGNTYNHGYFKYTQIIKFLDNVPPVIVGCPTEPVVFCDLTNNDPAQYNSNYIDRCEGPVNLTVRATDACAKSNLALSYKLFLDMDSNGSMETYLTSSSPGAWPIETSVQGDTLTGKIKFPNGHGFPYGKHKVEWVVNDNCAGQTICKYEFEVKDCKAPTVVCHNGLSINMMQTGMISLWASDFLLYTFDNCTPASQLKVAIRKSGTGTGFPNGVTGVTFDCTEVGTQFVEIWSEDAYGNAGYCETYVNVQDNIGTCPPTSNKVSGTVTDALNRPLPAATLNFKRGNSLFWKKTDSLGVYNQYVINACGVEVRPSCNDNHAQGVTMDDVNRLALHLTGQDSLDTPYEWIAADVDRNGTLDMADLLLIRNGALGNIAVFPNTDSWRFVPRSYVFPTGVNPLSVAFPEKTVMTYDLCVNGIADFRAVKMGDINCSALSNNLQDQGADNRSAQRI
ncbi:MAG: hypothetical protein IT269_08900, partial [Saprospiraceae bacterium]|nr:hypothetical protein [Saprospiraceae bacterium]